MTIRDLIGAIFAAMPEREPLSGLAAGRALFNVLVPRYIAVIDVETFTPQQHSYICRTVVGNLLANIIGDATEIVPLIDRSSTFVTYTFAFDANHSLTIKEFTSVTRISFFNRSCDEQG